MAYDVSTLTVKGAELLAAATSADKLILSGCDATTAVLTKAEAMAISARPSSPLSTTTRVALEGATENHVFIRVFFVAGESTGGDANSLYIFGHKESDPNNDYVLAIMSSATSFHLPAAGDIANTYGTLLDIIYTPANGSVTTATSSVYITYGEFNNRAVTCFADGTPTTGTAQTIYGQKTFIDPVNVNGSGRSLDIAGQYLVFTGQNFTAQMKGIANGNVSYNGNTYVVAEGAFEQVNTSCNVKQLLDFNYSNSTYSLKHSLGMKSLYKNGSSYETAALVQTAVNYASNRNGTNSNVGYVEIKTNGPSSKTNYIKMDYVWDSQTSSHLPQMDIHSHCDINIESYTKISNFANDRFDALTNRVVLKARTDASETDESGQGVATFELATLEVNSMQTGVAGWSIQDENNNSSVVALMGDTLSSTATSTIHALVPRKASNGGHKISLGTSTYKWDEAYFKYVHVTGIGVQQLAGNGNEINLSASLYPTTTGFNLGLPFTPFDNLYVNTVNASKIKAPLPYSDVVWTSGPVALEIGQLVKVDFPSNFTCNFNSRIDLSTLGTTGDPNDHKSVVNIHGDVLVNLDDRQTLLALEIVGSSNYQGILCMRLS